MTFAALIAALGTIFAAGYGVLALLPGRKNALFLTEHLALCWLFGVGIVSLLIWFFGFFAHGALLPGLISLICFGLGFAGWKQTVLSPLRFPRAPVEILLAIIIATEFVVIFYLSFVHTLGWDGLLNWEIKARYAFVNGGVLPASYFRDGGRAFSHPEYPLAIPFTELWLYFWLGEPDQFWAKIIFPIFYVAGAFLLIGLGSRLTGKSWAGLLVAAFLFLVPQIAVEGGSVVVGYTDFPLSIFYLASIGCLCCATDKDNDHFFHLYAACLALLPWVKRDGVVLWAVAAACGVFIILRRKKSYQCFFALLPGLLIIAGWRFYLSAMHASQGADFLPVNLETLGSHRYRILPLLSTLLAEFHDLSTWSLFWFVVAVGAAYLLPRIRDPRVPVLLGGLIVPVVFYSLTFVFSNWPNYLEHVGLSISRLLMHVAPVGFLITMLAVFSRGQTDSAGSRLRVAITCTKPVPKRTAVVELA